MKNKLFLYITILCVFVGTAQKKGGHNYEKIKTLKINFISSELNLSPETAEKFWPIYNEYEKINRQLRSSEIQNIKKEVKNNGAIKELSDEKANELSLKFLKIAEKYLNNKKNCFEKLESILSPQQHLQLQFAEIEFNYKVIRKLHKENKSDNQ